MWHRTATVLKNGDEKTALKKIMLTNGTKKKKKEKKREDLMEISKLTKNDIIKIFALWSKAIFGNGLL